MTRGRKKDLTKPASRSLTLQRDYRARKAKYVAELEERCKRAEQEAVELRKQLEVARTGIPASVALCNSEITQLSTELLQHLSAASASLLRFQQLTTCGGCRSESWPQPQNITSNVSDQPLLQPPITTAASTPSHTTSVTTYEYQSRSEPEPLHRLSNARSEAAKLDTRRGSNSNPPEDEPSPSPSSECCGGFLDCEGLI